MKKQEKQVILWEECKSIFKQTENSHTDRLLKEIIEIVKKYKLILSDVADNDFLEYITNIDSSEFIVGTNGDNYELILKNYIKMDECSLEEIWTILSQLVWDLSAII